MRVASVGVLSGSSGGSGGGDLLVDKGDKLIKGAATLVRDTSAVSLEEDESGETSDTERTINVVGGGVDLGDGDVGLGILEVLAELVPDGGEGLAVSAPGGIELNKDVLGGGGLIKVLVDEDLDRAVVGLRERLGLLEGDDGTIEDGREPDAEVGLVELSLLVPDELDARASVLGGGDGDDGGVLVSSGSHVGGRGAPVLEVTISEGNGGEVVGDGTEGSDDRGLEGLVGVVEDGDGEESLGLGDAGPVLALVLEDDVVSVGVEEGLVDLGAVGNNGGGEVRGKKLHLLLELSGHEGSVDNGKLESLNALGNVEELYCCSYIHH